MIIRSDVSAVYCAGDLIAYYDTVSGEMLKPFDARAYCYEPPSWEELLDRIAKSDGGPLDKVYFIGCRKHAIKIGTTKSITRRFATLQQCSPVPLQVLATRPGALALEQAYHHRFQRYRLHNEWFSPAEEILAEIERLSELTHPESRSTSDTTTRASST